MRARDLMTMDVVTVKPDTSVKHVAQICSATVSAPCP